MCWLINLHLKAEHIMMKNHKDGRARFMRIEMKEGIKKIATFSILRWVRNLNEKFMHTTIVDKSREHIVLASCMYIVCNRMRAYGVIYEMKNAVLDYNLSLNKALDMYLWDAKQYRKSAKKKVEEKKKKNWCLSLLSVKIFCVICTHHSFIHIENSVYSLRWNVITKLCGILSIIKIKK